MKRAIILLCCIAMFGCETEPTIIFNKIKFDMERALWEQQGIADYTVVEDMFFAVPHEVLIIVENNVITYKEDLDDPDRGPEDYYEGYIPPGFHHVKTVSELYEKIAKDYEEEIKKLPNVEWYMMIIDIVYNKEFHYPEEVTFSRFVENSGTGPSAWRIKLKEFKLLPTGDDSN